MRQLAAWSAAGCVTVAAAAYVLAKVDFFTRFDPVATEPYLTAHWVFWAVMVAFATLAALLSALARERVQ
jgi:ABC-type Na+ efflux pump permease subunit